MPIAQIIQVLFLLVALLMVVWCFFPTWNMPPVVAIPRIIGLVVGLVVLYLIYLLLLAILGAAT